MVLFLTSHTGGWKRGDAQRTPEALCSDNALVDNLKARWKDASAVLLIAAAPHSYERNDSIRETFSQALPMSGLSIREMALCDGRDPQIITKLDSFDVIILSGGHVPTQNAFFRQLGLKERLRSFSGIVIGISAGTMNCAETVYAHPELDGEATDPEYLRFIPGLGLTKHQILPHYQSIKHDILDGLRVFEDVAYPDSMDNTFYALNDGSYILEEKGSSTLYGEAYRLHNEVMEKICENDQWIYI